METYLISLHFVFIIYRRCRNSIHTSHSEARNADCTGTILFLTPTVSAPITPLECSIPIRSA
uniref:Uncharacterized protein n=1 Tax=Meloidogyne enterolobii TaxID=390850 RepID=A0A6V7XLR6_MELEN|nr:unnamed protein product [Meloidogyne enterolobii]